MELGDVSVSTADSDVTGRRRGGHRSVYMPYTYTQGILVVLLLGAEIAVAVSHDPLANYCVTYVVAVAVVVTAGVGRAFCCDVRNAPRGLLPALWLVTGLLCLAEVGVALMQIGLTGYRWKEPDETFWYVYLCEGMLILASVLVLLSLGLVACRPRDAKRRRRRQRPASGAAGSSNSGTQSPQQKLSIYFPE